MSSEPATSSAPKEQPETPSDAPPIKPKSTLDSESAFPKTITLKDGSVIPVGLPPGLDPTHGKMALEYLKANPEYAQNTVKQVDRIMRNPAMAQQFFRMQAMMATPEYQKQMANLKADPELKDMFDDISKRGPEAIDKYWNDMELMSKISKKMAELRLSSTPNGQKQDPEKIDSLEKAAKVDSVEAIKRLIADGKDVNQKDGRGITPLGVAVGFNRVEAVKELLSSGADVNLTDNQGNTVLHYAAGYGRVEAAEMLLEAKADVKAMNNDNQTPLDVAELNREVVMIEFLKKHNPSEESGKFV